LHHCPLCAYFQCFSQVFNQSKRKSDGSFDNIYGWAEATDASKPGALTVHLQGVPVGAPYWVLNIGPVVDNKYQWSVVSDPFKLSLFVLARDVREFHAKYATTVYTWLANNGFDQFYNTPTITDQSNCTYAPPPADLVTALPMASLRGA